MRVAHSWTDEARYVMCGALTWADRGDSNGTRRRAQRSPGLSPGPLIVAGARGSLAEGRCWQHGALSAVGTTVGTTNRKAVTAAFRYA